MSFQRFHNGIGCPVCGWPLAASFRLAPDPAAKQPCCGRPLSKDQADSLQGQIRVRARDARRAGR